MPFIPRKQKERAYQPPKKKFYRKANNSKFYNSTKWRKKRKWYINRHPFCEVCLTQNKVSEGVFLDHVIRIESGGAEYDDNNLMIMCERHHNIKSGKEAHNPILIPHTRNKDGDIIPKDKKSIISIY